MDYEKSYRGIRWHDTEFEIPAKYTRGKSRLHIRIELVSAENDQWDEYYYWVFSYR